MTEEQKAAAAVAATIDTLREEAWGLAQQYVLDQRQVTIDRMKHLRETADLLTWAAAGRNTPTYSLDWVG